MNKIIKILLVAIIVFSFSSCATLPTNAETPNPPEDIVIMIMTEMGYLPVLITKGFFDDPDNWMTREEFERLADEVEEQEEAEI